MELTHWARAAAAVAVACGATGCAGTSPVAGGDDRSASPGASPPAQVERDQELTCPGSTHSLHVDGVNSRHTTLDDAFTGHLDEVRGRETAPDAALFRPENFERVPYPAGKREDGSPRPSANRSYLGFRSDGSAFVRLDFGNGDLGWRFFEQTQCEPFSTEDEGEEPDERLVGTPSPAATAYRRTVDPDDPLAAVTCPGELTLASVHSDLAPGPPEPPHAASPKEALRRFVQRHADAPRAEEGPLYRVENFERLPGPVDGKPAERERHAQFAGYRADGSVFAVIGLSRFTRPTAWYQNEVFYCATPPERNG